VTIFEVISTLYWVTVVGQVAKYGRTRSTLGVKIERPPSNRCLVRFRVGVARARTRNVPARGPRRRWPTLRQAQALLNAPDSTTIKSPCARAIIAVLLGRALRRCDGAALTDGRSSGAFAVEATVAARRAIAPDLGNPHAGGLGDGQRATGAGIGRWHRAREAKSIGVRTGKLAVAQPAQAPLNARVSRPPRIREPTPSSRGAARLCPAPVAALTDGRPPGVFTPGATGAARHADAPELSVWCLRDIRMSAVRTPTVAADAQRAAGARNGPASIVSNNAERTPRPLVKEGAICLFQDTAEASSLASRLATAAHSHSAFTSPPIRIAAPVKYSQNNNAITAPSDP